MKICAVILAAGLSTRMKDFKPLLPFNDNTILKQAIKNFMYAGISDIYVVTGHKSEDVEAETRSTGMHSVFNPDYKLGMFSSVLAGINALPADTDGFFILPVDIPFFRPSTIRDLIFEYRICQYDVIFPCFKKERGHPPLINCSLIKTIKNHDGSGGLKTVLENCKNVLDKEIPDIGITLDLDFKEDYEKLSAIFQNKIAPCREECEAMWDIIGTPQNIRDHCETVAIGAIKIAKNLNKYRSTKPQLDLDLIKSAALLHDIARTKPNHEALGAAILDGFGFSALSEIVSTHHRAEPYKNELITEREIVFLADKFFTGTTPVSFSNRYEDKLKKWKTDPEATKAIKYKFDQADKIKKRYENETGSTIENIIHNEEDV